MILDPINTVYLCTMVIAVIVSILKRNSGSRGMTFLSLYLVSNFITELLTCIVSPDQFNHYIYATGAIFGSAFLFVYLTVTSRSRSVALLSACAYIAILGAYIRNRMWLQQTLIRIDYISLYNGFIVFVLFRFIWHIMTADNNDPSERLLSFGFCMLAYHILAVVAMSFFFTSSLNDNDMPGLMYLSFGLNIAYYVMLTFVLLKLPSATGKV